MTQNLPLYLDYAATTPLDPRVTERMIDCLQSPIYFANAHSSHAFGLKARAMIEAARLEVAELLNAVPRNIILTSGATEANNLAIKGVAEYYKKKGRHIITVSTEHKSILEPCQYLERQGFSVTYLKPGPGGLIDFEALQLALQTETILISVMHINNETGVIQDIERIGALAREKGIFFHVDAAQSIGKMPIDVQKMPIDLLSISGHKIYGPKGIGALYVSDIPRVRLVAQLLGGGQERKLRAGTLATHQIVGLGEACRILKEEGSKDVQHSQRLCHRFLKGLEPLNSVQLNGDRQVASPHIVNVRFLPQENPALFALPGLAVSTGSACNALYIEPSYVLKAMGLSDKAAQNSLRFSWGRFTTEADIEEAVQQITALFAGD